MKRVLGLAIGGVFLTAGLGLAIPPGPGQHFDCSDGGTSSCATDDPGCVSNTKGHLKCSSKIGKSFAKAIVGVIKCHMKQAQMRFQGSSVNGAGNSEENCEDNPGNSAKANLDDALASLAASGICDPTQLSDAATEEAVLFGGGPLSLDGQNGNVFCDSSTAALIGDDDPGWVAPDANVLKCELAVAKNVAKLVKSAIKCHAKMNSSFFKAADFSEELCEETAPTSHGALDKYNRVRDKLIAAGICPPCLNGAGMDTLATNVLGQADGANNLVYPCNLGP